MADVLKIKHSKQTKIRRHNELASLLTCADVTKRVSVVVVSAVNCRCRAGGTGEAQASPEVATKAKSSTNLRAPYPADKPEATHRLVNANDTSEEQATK